MTTKPKLDSLPKEEEIYLVFPDSTCKTIVHQRFRTRFGYSPDGTFCYNNQWWAGPVEPKSLMVGLA